MFKSVLLSFITLLLVVSVPALAFATNQCVPLPAGIVPDESNKGWTERVFPQEDLSIEVQTQSGERVIVGVRRYYIHDNGMKLGVYSYFGKIGFKAWSCDKDRDPVTKDTSDHMIAIPQAGGSWFVKHAQSPDEVEVMFGTDGHPKSVRIMLHGVEAVIEK